MRHLRGYNPQNMTKLQDEPFKLFNDGGGYHYRNQFINLLRKSMDWFLYDNGLRHERVKLSRSHIRMGSSFYLKVVRKGN